MCYIYKISSEMWMKRKRKEKEVAEVLFNVIKYYFFSKCLTLLPFVVSILVSVVSHIEKIKKKKKKSA
jgi:hypothetical protein